MKKRFLIFFNILISITISQARQAEYYFTQQAGTRSGYSLPYLEVFSSTTLPAEWLSDMSLSADHGTSGSIGLNMRLQAGTTTCYAISPQVGSISTDTYLSFHYRFVNYLGFPSIGTSLATNDRVEIQVSDDDGATFTTIHTIDQNNHTPTAEFTNKVISLASYNGDFIYVRFLCTRESGDYYFDLDNVLFEEGLNMSYSTSTVEQTNLSNIGIGTTNNEIIRLQVVTQKSGSPLYLTSINVNVSGETNVNAAKVFYTTSPVFSTAAQFGGTINTPSGSFSFTGSQLLSQGNNYFWLAYNIKATATPGSTVDGSCSEFYTSETGIKKIPAITSPAGNRKVGPVFTGTKTIPGDYATVSAAVTALNSGVIGPGGVIFNVAGGHAESNAGLIWLTATGTISNPIVFRKSGPGNKPLVTRTDAGGVSPSNIGYNGDAVIMLEGSDYVTFDSIDVATQNSGIEYGFYFRKASATDACKYVTVKNSGITMTKGSSRYVAGICAGNNIAGASGNGITVLTTGGRHENISLTGNVISGVFTGIYIKGSDEFNDQNLIIGNNSNGNIIQNFGGNTNYETWGIYIYGNQNASVSYNSINNMTGGGSAFTADASGIFNGSTSDVSFTAENNSISLTSVASQLYGIYNSGMGTLEVNNNTVAMVNSGVSAAVYAFIYNHQSFATTSSYTNISNNIFASSTIQTTGTAYLIYNNSSRQNPEVTNIQGNLTSGSISRPGTSGSMYLYYNGSAATGTENISGNRFSNISLSGTSSFLGIYSRTASGHSQNVFDNTISNISGGSGDINAINLELATNRSVYGNEISAISGGGKISGIIAGSGSNPGKIYKNEIFNLSSSSTSSLSNIVSGIHITSGTAVYIYDNFISDLKAPAANSDDAIRGISLAGTLANSTIGVYYNTVYLDAGSGGANFGTTGIYHTASENATTAALDLRNNIIINKSIQNGTASATAFRRSASSLVNYKSTSNNNIFYAGNPDANHLIYTPNQCQTIDDYRTVVGPNRDSISFSEDPVFVNVISAPYNLRLQDGYTSYCESGARPVTSPVQITDDFDGAARPSTPDIGADEFSGIAAFVDIPAFFAANAFASDQNNLVFDSNSDNDEIVIVSNMSGIFTNPSGVPVIGEDLASGEVIYYGTESPFIHDGLETGTTVYYKAFCYNGSNYSFGRTDNATPVPNPVSTWIGSVSNDWTNLANWSDGVPGANHEVVINAGDFDPLISAMVTVFKITVTTGAVFTVTPTGQLTVTGN
jgi:hypothetical protein